MRYVFAKFVALPFKWRLLGSEEWVAIQFLSIWYMIEYFDNTL